MRCSSLIVCLALPLAACSTASTGSSSGSTGGSTGAGGTGGTKDAGSDAESDAPVDAPADVSFDVPIVPPPDGSIQHPCDLPGALQFTASGTVTVPGGSPSWPSLAFLHLPQGFCARYFGTVGNARQIRFAPGGELFVASPTQLSTGGGPNGQNA